MRPEAPARGHLVRFSMGLEEEGALRADLAQALRSAFG
jgi:cystathionine beta-lyase/cystathionine gamma-synthase